MTLIMFHCGGPGRFPSTLPSIFLFDHAMKNEGLPSQELTAGYEIGDHLPHCYAHFFPTGKGEPLLLQREAFPHGSEGEESAYNVGHPGSIPRSGRSPGEGDGYPLQYACLKDATDRGAWRATAHRAAKSQTRLSK